MVASAALQVQARGFNPVSTVIQLPAVLKVPGNLAVGGVLWSSSKVVTQLSDMAEAEISTVKATVPFGPTTFGEGVYATDVEGVGIAIKLYLNRETILVGALY